MDIYFCQISLNEHLAKHHVVEIVNGFTNSDVGLFPHLNNNNNIKVYSNNQSGQ